MEKELKIVQDPNGSYYMYFHVNVKLSDEILVHNSPDGSEKSMRLLRSILNVPGVQSAFLERYKLRIERGKAFEWEEITPHVENLIKHACAEGDLTNLT